MKALRGLYIAAVYILGLPLTVIFTLTMLVIHIVWCVRDGFDIRDLKDYQKAFYEGMYISHKINMHWVKYGSDNHIEKYLEEVGLD